MSRITMLCAGLGLVSLAAIAVGVLSDRSAVLTAFSQPVEIEREREKTGWKQACGKSPSRVPVDIASLKAVVMDGVEDHDMKTNEFWQSVKDIQADHNKTTTDSGFEDLVRLFKATAWVVRQRKGQDTRTVETGFALGASALAITGALMSGGASAHHSAIDPFQDYFKNVGLHSMEKMLARHKPVKLQFDHLALPAAVGLANLYVAGECLDFAYLDDGHMFDDNMVEFFYVHHMMPVGGVLFIDDLWMQSVKTTVSFVETNLGYVRVTPLSLDFVGLVKMTQDNRHWDHYVDFQAAWPPQKR